MKLSYFIIGWFLFVIGFVAVMGLRGHHFSRPPMEIFPDMVYQAKVKDQVTSDFFANGQAARLPIDGTVATQMPVKLDYAASGKWDDTHWGDGVPTHAAREGQPALQIDRANLNRGRERYTIYCAMCHGASGDGKGITAKYGLVGAANYHTDSLRAQPDGEIYNTINNGKGQMLGYGANLSIDDRWRIVMYLRALQRSQYAPFTDATPEEQKELAAKTPKKPDAPAPAQPTAPVSATPETKKS